MITIAERKTQAFLIGELRSSWKELKMGVFAKIGSFNCRI